MPGELYYNPAQTQSAPIHEQLEAFTKLAQEGKILYAGMCNETAYGVSEFVKLAEQHNFTRIASVQNGYSLLNRSAENGLVETLDNLDVGFIGWSPLAFGLLTGKYDGPGVSNVQGARLSLYNYQDKNTRWTTPWAIATAKKYNQLAQSYNMKPAEMALRYCYSKWFVDCTIVGASSVEQLEENISYLGQPLSAELLQKIDKLRLAYRDPVN
jgi:aryl-alcohol dehydrogenase-like predicted oxidoreductase